MISGFIEYPLHLQTDTGSFVRPTHQQMMLQDATRLNSFHRAIETSVEPGMRVLEIGAGTGLLSMLAIRAGAEHVTAIEATSLADLAEKSIRENGLERKINVVEAMSFDATLPECYDLLITETLGHIGIDEGILPTAIDARERLLKTEASIIPQSLDIMVAAVNVPTFDQQLVGFWKEGVAGFSFQAWAKQTCSTTYLTSYQRAEFLSSWESLFHFDIGESYAPPYKGQTRLGKTRKGPLNGLLLAFRAVLNEQVQLNSQDAPSWRPLFLPLGRTVSLGNNEPVDVELSFYGPGSGNMSSHRTVWQVTVAGDGQRSLNGTC